MDVTEIIRAVEKLSPVDRAKVADALAKDDSSKPADGIEERQAELHRQWLEQGILKSIPDRFLPKHKFSPIKIKGKPLSETIIEERR